MQINENTLEQAIISELQEKGYEYLYGPDIVRDYHDVILEDCFRESVFHINPGITDDILSETLKQIKNLGLLKLEELNEAFQNYQLDIPTLFNYNAFSVILDGIDTRIGTITSDFTRYMAWKSENGEKPDENSSDYFSIMLNGMMPKERLLDIICNFIRCRLCSLILKQYARWNIVFRRFENFTLFDFTSLTVFKVYLCLSTTHHLKEVGL